MADGVGDDVRDVVVHQGVCDLPATPCTPDHPRAAQHPQVLGDQRLRSAELLHQLVHAALAHAELGDDRDTDRRGQGAQEFPGRTIAVFPDDVDDLGATTNSQGRALRAGAHRFLHIEMNASLRTALRRRATDRGRFIAGLGKALRSVKPLQ